MNSQLIHDLKKSLGPDAVLHSPEDLLLYEYDGSVEVGKPQCVVFPRNAADVVSIVQIANRYNTPLIGRGAGTGLSGGAIARHGGIITVFSRMNRILEIDVENQRARVQPGVVNSDLSVAVAHTGLHFAPDPSSQKACTIGGNVSENSGGPHTLAYGVTTNHVLGLEVVLPNGELVRLGGSALDSTGYDLTGLFVGSEGTFASGHRNYGEADPLAGDDQDAAGNLRSSGRCHRNGGRNYRSRNYSRSVRDDGWVDAARRRRLHSRGISSR